MANFKSSILTFLIAFVACFTGPAASAEDAVTQQFRIGLINADPGQLLRDFDPFAAYLGSRLRSSGTGDVTVFVARDLDQLRSRIKKGNLDFVLTSAFPVVDMERNGVAPAIVAVQGSARDYSAIFFVREKSPLHNLRDLRGKTVVFGTPSSTTGFAMARAELIMNELFLSEETDNYAPADAVRYQFAGEAINQAFRVIRSRADAGVFSSSDWEELPLNVQSQLRVIHRTAPITRLLGSFHASCPPALREIVEKTLVEMSGDREGRAALATALHITKFERLTEDDRSALEDLKQQLSEPDAE
jgi:phosphonate transport system substrate-binding protein